MDAIKLVFIPIIVLHNTIIADSCTCRNLECIQEQGICPLIVDNSTVLLGNAEHAAQKFWHYISMDGNKGLSVAYNAALDLIASKWGLDNVVIILLDDDSEINEAYFSTLRKAIADHPDVDIFAPVIQGQDGSYYSPNSYGKIKSHQLKAVSDIIPQSKFNAINSCTAIRGGVFSSYRFDTRLFLDQVDHKFFEDQRHKGTRFQKLDIVIRHNFSLQESSTNPEAHRKRYEILVRDFLTFSSRSRGRLTLGVVKVLYWSIRESLNYRNPGWLPWFIRQMLKWAKNGNRLS